MVKKLSFNSIFPLILTLGIILMSRVFAVSMAMSDEDKMILGKSFFNKSWVAFPASTMARDGLGPLFNQNACLVCHPKGGRSQQFVIKLDNPDTIYGVQINTKSAGSVPIEARVKIEYQMRTVQYENGDKVHLKKPIAKLDKLGYGAVNSRFSVRISPSLHGLGLLEKVSNKPANRFNLTANEPSILSQVANAAHHDMGLTNPLYLNENCTQQQVKCLQAPKSEEVDLPAQRLEAITYFVQSLDSVSAIKPIKLFGRLGCDNCHTPSYALEKRTIYPYSDLLVHDVGEQNSGGFRTAPLWNSKKSPNFWHDGRAETVEEAILWHAGEAQLAKESFVDLNPQDREKLIKFIEGM